MTDLVKYYTDLVKYYRAGGPCEDFNDVCRHRLAGCPCTETADRIEELEAALNEIVHGSSDGMTHGGIKCRAIAKAALKEQT